MELNIAYLPGKIKNYARRCDFIEKGENRSFKEKNSDLNLSLISSEQLIEIKVKTLGVDSNGMEREILTNTPRS
jgi:hypothetical protein